jgi:hypothetical protein
MSLGVGAQLWGRAAVPALLLGWLLWRWPASEVASLPLSIAPRSQSTPAGADVIEFRLPESDPSEGRLVVIGSLGDAGEVYPVSVESVPIHSTLKSVELAEVRFERPTPKAERHSTQLVSWSSMKSAGAAASRPSSSSERQRLFFLQLGPNPNLEASYQPVPTRLAAESSQVRVWLDDCAQQDLTSDEWAWLAHCLEDSVLPQIADTFGEIADLDGDGKLSICLTPRLSKLPANTTPVEGLVQINDFLLDLPRPFSNHADVMFLSSALRPGPHAQAIVSHEAAHLAVFSRRRELDSTGRKFDDDWLNEGLAHCAETACGGDWSNLEDRIAAFSRSPHSSPLVVTDAGQQGLWRHAGARGAAWSFFHWLADDYGPDVLREIACHPAVGCAKLEQVTRLPFAELFRRWSVSVRLRESPADVAAEFPVSNVEQRAEFSLRGTSHLACRIQRDCGVRITAPRQSRLQVTVVDAASESRRCWVGR